MLLPVEREEDEQGDQVEGVTAVHAQYAEDRHQLEEIGRQDHQHAQPYVDQPPFLSDNTPDVLAHRTTWINRYNIRTKEISQAGYPRYRR